MPSAQQKKEFILHELQHAVQEREGFALGSNPRKEATRLQNTLTSLLKQKDKARERNDYEAVKELDLKIDQVRMISPKESYRRQAGEVESRLVEERSGLKPSRNKNYFPGNQEEYGVNLDPNRGLAEDLPRKKQAVVTKRGLTDYSYSIDRESVKLANGGLMLQTEAGENMKKENPVEEKQDINQDGKYEAWEQVRQEAIKMAQKFETPEMNMGGLMQDGVGVIIGIEEESGNEIPAGSMPEEVADDVSAMSLKTRTTQLFCMALRCLKNFDAKLKWAWVLWQKMGALQKLGKTKNTNRCTKSIWKILMFLLKMWK